MHFDRCCLGGRLGSLRLHLLLPAPLLRLPLLPPALLPAGGCGLLPTVRCVKVCLISYFAHSCLRSAIGCVLLRLL